MADALIRRQSALLLLQTKCINKPAAGCNIPAGFLTVPQNPSYIPAKDLDLYDWASNFATTIAANPTDFGLIAGDATAITAAVNPFLAAMDVITNPATKTPVAIAAKDAAKAAMLSVVRPYGTGISQNAAVTAGDKTAVGVTNRITTRTRNSVVAAIAASSFTYDQNGNWELRGYDPATPTSKKRPLGALGWEIQVQTRQESADPMALVLDVVSTKPIYMLDGDLVPGIDVRYRVRWVGASLSGGAANVGPWSAWIDLIVSATPATP